MTLSLKRVLIIGSPGAGKSALARRLAEVTSLPAVHLDAHYWGAGWTEPPSDLWRARVSALMAAPNWIIDGNYTGTLSLRLAEADTVIFLDVPRWLCLWRVLRRAVLSLGRHRGEDMAAGCPERIDIPFLLYVWRFQGDHRVRVLAALRDFPGTVLVLRKSRDFADLIRTAQRQA
jgi:adenylate kinase family enzyme